MYRNFIIPYLYEVQHVSGDTPPTISAAQDLSRPAAIGRSPAEIVGSNPTRGHGYLSVVSVVCCQVEVSATS